MTELSLSVDVDAPAEAVWAAAVDWERQHEWMVGTRVAGGHGEGARVSAFTGWRGIGFTDPMTITTWDPPHRCVVRHEGRVVRGSAAFEVLPLPDGRSRFVWTEWIAMPRLLRPLVTPPLRRSLATFAQWVSTRETPASASRGTPVPR